MKRKVWYLAMVFGLTAGLLQSCKSPADTETLSDDELKEVITANDLTDEVINTVESFTSLDFYSRPDADSFPSDDCVHIRFQNSDDTLTAIWQFDSTGCHMPNGRVYKGTMVMQKIRVQNEWRFMVAFSDDFAIDSIDIDGTFERARIRETAENHPLITVDFDLTITPPNGPAVHTVGTRERETIRGWDTFLSDDNEWDISGSWTVESENGDAYYINVTTPLRYRYRCRWYVAGEMEIIKDGARFRVNFGDGECDSRVTVTMPDGTTEEVDLEEAEE